MPARTTRCCRFSMTSSCGPIDPLEPSARADWWRQYGETREVATTLSEFWRRVAAADDPIVVWLGRHSARELAFFLAWTDWADDRPYQIIDVTRRRVPFTKRDGTTGLYRPVGYVSILQPEALRSLFGHERPIAAQASDEGRKRWRQLQKENAPFRIVAKAGLVSASIDYFDPLLLAQASSEWQSAARIVGRAMGYGSDLYIQVGDVMLHARVAVLVKEGRLLVEGDPESMFCRIRLPL